MAPGSHICMFKYSFVAWKISSLNIFCVFVFLFRAHFRISCMSEINMQESKSKFWHLLYFSHISIDWFQIFACLVQECESEIMFSVSTLSTLKYLQKKNTFWMILQKILHVLHFQSRYFFYLCSVCCVTMCKPNNQNLGIANFKLGWEWLINYWSLVYFINLFSELIIAFPEKNQFKMSNII